MRGLVIVSGDDHGLGHARSLTGLPVALAAGSSGPGGDARVACQDVVLVATRTTGPDAHGLSRRTAQTGLLAAAFVVPESFASSLTPRSWLDQGIVTGLDTTLNYLLTATTQDVIEAAAGGVAPHLPTNAATAVVPKGNQVIARAKTGGFC